MKITVNDLTLEEKLNLLTGKDMWHTYGANGKLKELFMCDGPCGVRTLYADGTEKGVSFPCSCNMGNTWNEELLRWEGARPSRKTVSTAQASTPSPRSRRRIPHGSNWTMW